MDTIPFTAPVTVVQLASLRGVYLTRLERLVRLRSQHEQELNERGIRLLDHSIFSAYYACRNNGVRTEAGRIIAEGPSPAGDVPDVPDAIAGLPSPAPAAPSHASSSRMPAPAVPPNDADLEAST